MYGRSLPEERLLRQQMEEEQRRQQQQQSQQGFYSTASSSSHFRDQFRLSDSPNRLYSDGNLRGSLLLGVSGSSTLSRIPTSRQTQSRPPSRLAVESPLHQEPPQQQKSAATFLPPELAKLRAGHLGMAAKAQSTDRLFQHGELEFTEERVR